MSRGRKRSKRGRQPGGETDRTSHGKPTKGGKLGRKILRNAKKYSAFQTALESAREAGEEMRGRRPLKEIM